MLIEKKEYYILHSQIYDHTLIYSPTHLRRNMDHNFLQESAGSTHILNKSRDGNESDSPAGSLCSTEEREMKEAADLIQSPVSKKERKAMVQRKRRRKMKKTHRVIPMGMYHFILVG